MSSYAPLPRQTLSASQRPRSFSQIFAVFAGPLRAFFDFGCSPLSILRCFVLRFINHVKTCAFVIGFATVPIFAAMTSRADESGVATDLNSTSIACRCADEILRYFPRLPLPRHRSLRPRFLPVPCVPTSPTAAAVLHAAVPTTTAADATAGSLVGVRLAIRTAQTDQTKIFD